MKPIELFDATGWAEDARFPHADWQEAVAQESTSLGYGQWLVSQYEQEETQVKVVPKYVLEDLSLATPEEMEDFPAEDWRREVQDLSTRLSYRNWVAHQVEADFES